MMSQKDCNPELPNSLGLWGQQGEARPMDIVLASALFILVAGCVVGYSIRAETDSDRPAEPRRRRPF